MKILMVSVAAIGYRKFHKGWADELRRRGHEVAWAGEGWGEEALLAESGIQLFPIEMPKGMDILGAIRARSHLRKLYSTWSPDVVVSEGTLPGIAARLGRGDSRRKHVHIVHSWPWHDLTRPAVKAVAVRVERLAGLYTDHFHVIGIEDLAEGRRLEIFAGASVAQRAVGIDTALYDSEPDGSRVTRAREALGGGDPLYLFVGRIVHAKGLRELVGAFEQVRAELPGARLAIVGRPDETNPARAFEQDIHARIREKGLQRAVTFLSRVEDLPAAYAASDVFVMPSIYEGLGLVYIEAGAMGTPVIGYDVRGVREAIESGVNGWLVPPRDTRALADAMIRLGRDPSARQKLGEGGRTRWRGKFENADFTRDMVDAIERVGAGQ